MNKKTVVSDAQRYVWAWKSALYDEVASLPRREALRTLLVNADKATKASGVCLPEMQPHHSLKAVAEKQAPYA